MTVILYLFLITTPPTIAPNHHFRITLFPSAVGVVYILSSKGSPNPGWHLALTSTTTVLECIQCTSTNIGELISFLVQSGRAFRTHLSRDHIPLPIYHYSPPIIEFIDQCCDFQPSKKNYEETHTNFLFLPQGCAALLQGGII